MTYILTQLHSGAVTARLSLRASCKWLGTCSGDQVYGSEAWGVKPFQSVSRIRKHEPY
jgi:hypothetical protein